VAWLVLVMVATLPKGVQRLVFSFRRKEFDIGDIQMKAILQRKHLALHARGDHRKQAGLDGLPSLPARVSILQSQIHWVQSLCLRGAQ